MPSGPGWFWARVSTMNAQARAAGRRRCRAMWSGRRSSGSSAFSGTKTVPPPLTRLVDAVVEELAEEGEQRVVRRREADVGGHVRDEQRLVRRRAARRDSLTGGSASGSGSVVQGTTPGLPWVRTGKPAAAIGGRVGGGLVDDQVADRRAAGSRRRCPTSARRTSARAGRSRRRRSPRRPGRPAWSAAGTAGRPRRRFLGRAAGCCTSRRRCAARRRAAGSGIWLGPVPTSAPQGPVAEVVFATWASAILICLRM